MTALLAHVSTAPHVHPLVIAAGAMLVLGTYAAVMVWLSLERRSRPRRPRSNVTTLYDRLNDDARERHRVARLTHLDSRIR